MPEIKEFIKVTTRIATGGAVRRKFGIGLLMTTDAAIAAGGSSKALLFSDLAAANEVLDAGAALDGATAWFNADPAPQSLMIGRWATTDISTTIRGAPPGTIASIAVANAAFKFADTDISIDLSSGTTIVGADVTGAIPGGLQQDDAAFVVDGSTISIDLSGTSDYDEIAAAIQTELRDSANATLDNALFTYEVDHFEFALADTTAIIAFTAPGAGTDISDDLGMDAGSNPTVTTGVASTYAAIATAIQIEMQASGLSVLTGAQFDFDSTAFLLTLATGAASAEYLGAPDAGTDISGLLGLNQGKATYQQGHDQEAIVDAIGEIVALVANPPTYVARDASTPDTLSGVTTDLAMMAYAGGADMMAAVRSNEEAAEDPAETASLLALAFESQYESIGVYDRRSSHPEITALGTLSAINFDGVQSIITLHGKTMTGQLPTNVSDTAYAELVRKRVNLYTSVGGLPTFVEGFTFKAGHWADAVAWNLWAKSRIETAIWDAIRGSRRLTITALLDGLTRVMELGVTNGGIQPGRSLSATGKADVSRTTGNTEFDGVLSAGYLVHIGRLADQSQSDIDARISPPIKIWAIGSEAIHRANIDLVFQN